MAFGVKIRQRPSASGGTGSADLSNAVYKPYFEPSPVPEGALITSHTPLRTRLGPGRSTAWTRSAMVSSKFARDGMAYRYDYGTRQQGLTLPDPGSASGPVRSSRYQRMLNHLYDYSLNMFLYRVGFPRNLGWSERTEQLTTKVTSGPVSAMRPKPWIRANIASRRPGASPAKVVPAQSTQS